VVELGQADKLGNLLQFDFLRLHLRKLYAGLEIGWSLYMAFTRKFATHVLQVENKVLVAPKGVL